MLFFFQKKVHSSIEAAEMAVHMVNQLGLFSSNEQLDEVTTKELRYVFE